MDALYVGLALLSALLHAGWNAAVKARPNASQAMTAQMALAALLMLPLLVWSGLPSPSAAPWILLSATVNALTVTALLKAYATTGFGVVYPISRAISVMLVVPGATLLIGERIGATALMGVAFISLALAILAFGGRRDAGPSARAWFWIGVAGVATATVVLADAKGVRASANAVAYGCCTSILNALVMLWRQRRSDIDLVDLRREIRAMLPTACASVTSYLLILWVYTRAPIAPASALRDTSALFAIVLAVLWLKEPISGRHMAALALAALAIPLLRLG
jgi:drug/metabolite transporter (DMT)-like permease